MKLITFEDKDAKALLATLELAKHKDVATLRVMRIENDGANSEYVQLDDRELGHALNAVHRHFHFHVVRWLQAQGANLA